MVFVVVTVVVAVTVVIAVTVVVLVTGSVVVIVFVIVVNGFVVVIVTGLLLLLLFLTSSQVSRCQTSLNAAPTITKNKSRQQQPHLVTFRLNLIVLLIPFRT